MEKRASFSSCKVFAILCAAILLAVAFSAQATAYDWALQTKACSSTGAGAGPTNTYGTTPGGMDPEPLGELSPGKAYVGIGEGGFPVPGPRLYKTDIRDTLPNIPRMPVTWQPIYLWVSSTYPYNNVEMRWWTGTDLKPWMSYWVQILMDPTGKYAPGTRYQFGATHIPSSSPVVAFSWSGSQVAALKVRGFVEGVKMRLLVRVIPEPSGLFGLASGLLGLALCARRKRR